MRRRSFLKGAALVAASALFDSQASLQAMDRRSRRKPSEAAADLKFRPDGSFKLIQFTDTHFISGDSRSQRAMECVCEALDAEKPDLVIHTGDILFGRPDIESAIEILTPISQRGIPFAVALGNHDSQFGSSREDVYAAIRSLPGCINTAPKPGVYGCSNDVITLSGPAGPERAFYLFDSMDAVVLKGEEEIHSYDYIRHSQIGWYRAWSEKLREQNGGVPLPSMAFFHIPLCEMAEGLASQERTIAGNWCEPPCPSRVNSGLLAQFREMGDVRAIVNGHDHDCDFVMKYGTLYYIYGRYSGGDTVYNHLGEKGWVEPKLSGCRIFEFRCGHSEVNTKVRLYGGIVQQEMAI